MAVTTILLCVVGIVDLTQKIEVLGQGQAVDWKQAFREVRTYYKQLATVRLKEQQEKGQSNTTKLMYGKPLRFGTVPGPGCIK